MKSLLEAYVKMKSGAEDTAKLKGDQHKLDKNKNGKLDSDDFKKLRKEEQDPPFAGPYTTVKNNKNNGAQKARALAQKALKTAIIKGTEKYTSSPDKLKPKHFGMSEDVELDEGYEEIKVHSKDGKHIGTITHGKYQSVAYAHPTTKFGASKNPHPDEDSTTLAGPHETQKGIDYIHAHHRMMSEDVEQIDELSPRTLGSYVKKAKGSAIGSAQVMGMGNKMTGQKTQDKAEKTVQKRGAGINKAVDRLTREEVELKESMEVSQKVMSKSGAHIGTVYKYSKPNTLGSTHGASYHPHGFQGGKNGSPAAQVNWDHHGSEADAVKQIHQRHGQYKSAAKRALEKSQKHLNSIPEEVELTLEYYSLEELEDYMMSEDFEQLDELSKSTLGNYVKKAAHDATMSRKIASDFEHMSARAKKPSSKSSASELEKEYKSKSWKRRDNVNKAVDRLTKEEYMMSEGKKRSDRYHIVGKDGNPASLASYADQASAVKDRDEKHPGAVVRQVGPRGKIKGEIAEGVGNNHREFASAGKMHPDMAKHMEVGREMDFYAQGTGDKMSGKVLKKTDKEVHIKTTINPYKEKDSSTHKFKIASSLQESMRQEKEETMLTFKQFIENIEEAHEYKAGRYVHKGTYGTSHDDPGVKSKPFWQSADKDEDDKPKKAEAPAVKRGRGRPAGAKSGARQFGAAAKDGSGADYTGMKLHLPNSNR